MEPRLPTDQGFDVNVAGSFWGHPLKGYFSPYHMPNLEDGPKGEYLTDRLTSEAIRVMDDFSKQDKPWLLYMSYYTVHGPLHSKAEKTKKYAEKARQAKVKLKSPAYAGMVESLDENVGRMLDWLDEKGLRKNTIIIFTSDNGGMVRATDNRPLRSYKGDIYEGGIRVPCIIDWPGVIKPGSVSDTPVHGVDFYATLLAMTGLPQQPEHHEDSVNLVPLLKGDTDFERGPMVWHYPVGVPHIAHSKPGSVIRDGDWKYLRFYEDGREELYNLKDDIGETNNLAALDAGESGGNEGSTGRRAESAQRNDPDRRSGEALTSRQEENSEEGEEMNRLIFAGVLSALSFLCETQGLALELSPEVVRERKRPARAIRRASSLR